MLTNAADVLALTSEQAASTIPVSVTGIVTASGFPNWEGRFFVQDASAGVFVYSRNKTYPVPGDLIHVIGVSHPGGYAPDITKPHWTKLGTAALPEAKVVTIDRLMSGVEDSQRIEISGIVRSAQIAESDLFIEVASGGCRFRAFIPAVTNIVPQSLVGARVRVRGTAAAGFNSTLRHIVGVTVYSARPEDLTVLEPAPPDPFNAPLMPLRGIAQYRKDRLPSDQVHVRGMVTYQRKGEDLFLADETGGLEVKSQSTESLAPGDEVEAVGFPAVENFLPVLEDAEFRKINGPKADLVPQAANVTQLLSGLHHADFISLKGKLIDRLVPGGNPHADMFTPRTTLLVVSSNHIFTAESAYSEQIDLLASIPLDSTIEVSGICLLDSAGDGTAKSFRLLLPAYPAVRVLESPSWFTTKHLMASLLVVFLVLVIAIFRTVLVSKNNLILKSLVREKETAQHALQQAHDQLEERVQERTNQLKVEMTARKESELQFRATLTERTRLAQELHDTLEQTMTGIALQLDMVASLFARNPDDASLHLKLARNLMRQSQTDVRQSVWGLRSRASEQFNLTNAILVNSRQLAGGAGIKIEVETVGEPRALPEVIEENLMRISQEAITNVVKHSGANQVAVELQFSPLKVVLQIKDNGRGFNPEQCAGPQEGHFGLLGISERTERLGGRVEITGAAGAGTVVRVEIPLGAAAVPAVAIAPDISNEERSENTNPCRG